jgi:hypothetical protein
MGNKKQYDVISPDGFSINREGYYNSKKEAENALNEWVKRYEPQGYYSTVKHGERVRLMLDELADYCKIVEVNPEPDFTDTPMAEQMEIDCDPF